MESTGSYNLIGSIFIKRSKSEEDNSNPFKELLRIELINEQVKLLIAKFRLGKSFKKRLTKKKGLF